jgi:hypothetical protein
MANPFPFVDVKGFQDPYAAEKLRQAERVRQAELAELSPQPMYGPEEIAKRKAEFQLMQQQGQAGMLANDPSLKGIAQPLLARSMEAMKPQYREHGVFDEQSGGFTYFPGYKEARKTEAARRQQDLTENRSAQARSSYDLMAGRMNELRAIAGDRNANRGDEGSVTHAGADANGKPIFMHSKTGPFQQDAQGKRVPYLGPITPKLSEMPAAMQTAYNTNLNSLNQVNLALDMVGENPSAVGLVGWLPDVARQYVPGKSGSGGVDVRAAVSDIGSLKIHDRSGAAVTAAEFPRLRPFIPDVGKDSPATIQKKLRNFKIQYEAAIKQIESGYRFSRIVGAGKSYALIGEGGAAGQATPTRPIGGPGRRNGPQLTGDPLIDKYLVPNGQQ